MTRRQMLALSAASLAAGCIPADRTEGGAITSADKPEFPDRPNILVYLADTLRADRMSIYGHGIPTTPYFERSASDWFVFDEFRSHATWTKPSIASIYTGATPCVHKVSAATVEIEGERMNQTLPSNLPTLAEALSSAGYHTALFLSNAVVQREIGFARGFQHYHFEQLEEARRQRESLQSWLQTEQRSPFFAFVHQIDPHGPYSPSEEAYETLYSVSRDHAAAKLSAEDRALIARYHFLYDHPTPDAIPDRLKNMNRLSATGIEYLKGLYDAEVRYVSDQFEKLMEFLDSSGLLENTVIFFTSDHGEAFNEHGFFLHGHAPYEELIRIPLLARLPGVSGARVAFRAGHTDLTATILELAGLPQFPLARGRSLFTRRGVLNVLSPLPQMAWMLNRDQHRASEAAMIMSDWKLISYAGCQRFRYFNLVADPGETLDHCTSGTDLDATPFEVMVSRLLREKAEQIEMSKSVNEPAWVPANPREIEQLRALGYF